MSVEHVVYFAVALDDMYKPISKVFHKVLVTCKTLEMYPYVEPDVRTL